MELKEYQSKTLKQISTYLTALADLKTKSEKVKAVDPELAFDFTRKAWEKVGAGNFISKKNGLSEDLPNFYIKIPTGGGKTILACHTIDLVNRIYLRKQTGIVLWVVPTTQIYRQTIEHLRNREHPYRQVLDMASAGRTVILEKTERFNKQDIEENLVVMMLMLPSANRQNKETLKVFRDAGGFADFFPQDDDHKGNEVLLSRFPNLDYFGTSAGLFGRTVKTSLGNTLRILKPLIIIDEGHKAFSDTAQDTIRKFNPSMVVELSATPPKGANILVNISGQELNREQMIKLDLHINNKATLEWRDAIRAAVERRNLLEEKAKEHESNTGQYIRPICLIQVERTGKDQRAAKFIHAEDVKEYLIKHFGIAEANIAIKSSEKDDIEGIDLLNRSCGIRYIITKQALQEGWDCAFAYILAVLTNPGAQLSITQLVGRILRQPGARKTGVRELDESYVFCFRPKATELLANVKKGFEDEGLGDLASRINIGDAEEDLTGGSALRKLRYRDNFKRLEGKIYLPKFTIQETDSWRDLNYESDILRHVDWSKIDLSALKSIKISKERLTDQEFAIGLSENKGEVIKEKKAAYLAGGFKIDKVFMARQIMDIIPNPWIAFEIAGKAIEIFLEKYDPKLVADNLVYIIEELRKLLEIQRDKQAENVFRTLVQKKILFFFLITDKSGVKLRSSLEVPKSTKFLTRNDNTPIQRSLFELNPEEWFNEMEKSVALFIDEQEKLLWWYRNISRVDYGIQGWKKHKIYPDFIFSEIDAKNQNNYSKVFVVETKGLHLKNEDTDYKRSVLELCNKLGKEKDWGELKLEFEKQKFEFQVISEEEWRARINGMLG